jgi:molybdopterin/thiamine biosynthesis adenylyltransferase
MSDFGDRHSGTIGGQLHDADSISPISVCVKVEAGAETSSVQHTVAMTCNLLSRLKNVVSAISVDTPEGAMLRDGIIPGSTPGLPLKEELKRYVTRIGVIPLATPEHSSMTVYAGPGDAHGPRAVGLAWSGGITLTGYSAWDCDSTLPFGPYIAACFLAAEVFRMKRLRGYKPASSAYYDCWDLAPHNGLSDLGPRELTPFALAPVTLVGVGVVGAAWLQAMWAAPAAQIDCLACDGDEAGIDDTNLNRYSLFGVGDVGKKKAYAAAALLSRAGFNLVARDIPFETLDEEGVRDIVICAADTNEARGIVQSKYRPVALMASTHNMRAEILRSVRPGEMACLRCYNPPVIRPSDETLRKKIGNLSESALRELTDQAKVGPNDAEEYMKTGKCGEAGEALLAVMRVSFEERAARFAIGFASVAAGTLLAAETIKLGIPDAQGMSLDRNRAVLQFQRPDKNGAASALAREGTCPACREGAALRIWRERFAAHSYNDRLLDI